MDDKEFEDLKKRVDKLEHQYNGFIAILRRGLIQIVTEASKQLGLGDGKSRSG